MFHLNSCKKIITNLIQLYQHDGDALLFTFINLSLQQKLNNIICSKAQLMFIYTLTKTQLHVSAISEQSSGCIFKYRVLYNMPKNNIR